MIPSGKQTVSYSKWPLIVDLPIKNGDVPHFHWQIVSTVQK
jgi:hypothetical protein